MLNKLQRISLQNFLDINYLFYLVFLTCFLHIHATCSLQAKTGPQESQTPEVREEAYKEDDFPLVEEDCVRDRLSDLDIHESVGPMECTHEC